MQVRSPSLGTESATKLLYDKLDHVPGWFDDIDAGHFSLLLAYQNLLGVQGDILEIGVYCGRSACVLAHYLQDGQTLVLVDPFYGDYHDEETGADIAWMYIQDVNPSLARSSVEFIVSRSQDVQLTGRFRFVHIDGDHAREGALADLRMCAEFLAPGGVIAVDDYTNRDWPEVTEAVDAFLEENRRFYVLADPCMRTNRKLYLASSS